MSASPSQFRLAVMTFAYEADGEIAHDMISSVLRSCRGVEIDVYVNDDASPSHVGAKLVEFCCQQGVRAVSFRDPVNLGIRGAVYRTIKLLREIARSQRTYDVVLRIDTDALVIRDGLCHALRSTCTDPRGLYGVLRYMRPKERVAFLLDMMPIGLKRIQRGGHICHDYAFSRFRPVWWASIGARALVRGYRFGFVEGACYALGGNVPRLLLESGMLDHDTQNYGLITHEEDVIVTLMCAAAGLPIYEIDRSDSTWREVSRIGADVLHQPVGRVPFVYHALKPSPEGQALRAEIKAALPFFAG